MLVKALYKVSSCLVLLAICIFFTTCRSQPVVTEEIDNPDSLLLAVLVKESDLATGWHWLDNRTREELWEPTSDNYHTVESTLRSLTGRYGPEQHYITIVHGVQWCNEPVSLEMIRLSGTASFPVGQEFPIEIISVGSYIKSKCVKNTSTMVCQVIVGYDYITSGVMVYAPGDMDIQTVEVIINDVLGGPDVRIKALDGLPK